MLLFVLGIMLVICGVEFVACAIYYGAKGVPLRQAINTDMMGHGAIGLLVFGLISFLVLLAMVVGVT